jgi:hypothetical protein
MNDRGSGWDRHADEQRRSWLRLSHAERLRWLEQAKRFYEVALGAARRGSVARDGDDPRSPSDPEDPRGSRG